MYDPDHHCHFSIFPFVLCLFFIFQGGAPPPLAEQPAMSLKKPVENILTTITTIKYTNRTILWGHIINVQMLTPPNNGEVEIWSDFILKVKQFSPTLLQNVSRCFNQRQYLKGKLNFFLVVWPMFRAQGAGGPGSTAVVPGTKLCAYKVTVASYYHHCNHQHHRNHCLQHPLPQKPISTKTSLDHDWYHGGNVLAVIMTILSLFNNDDAQ